MDCDSSNSEEERPTTLWEAMSGFISNSDVIFYVSYNAGLFHRVLRSKGVYSNDPDVKNLDYDNSNVKKAQKSFDETFPSNIAFQSDDCRIDFMIPPLFTDTRNTNISSH
jgi:hypothetical protein